VKRNGLVILAGIVILVGALMLSWAGAQQPAETGGCCKMNAAPAAMDSKCPIMQGGGKEIFEAYMNDTAGLHKDLAEARKQLDAALMAKPIDKAAVAGLVAKVNELQSALFAKAVDMCVALKEKLPAGQDCEMCKSPVACCMMLSDQCPMKFCGGKCGCCETMKTAPCAKAGDGCSMGGCMMEHTK